MKWFSRKRTIGTGIHIKKVYILLLFSLLITGSITAQHSEPGSDSRNVNGLMLMTSNGFAPIPAFSFDKPAAMVFLSIDRSRFSYRPDVALGFDGDLWMNNHWFFYRLPVDSRFFLKGGVNLSLFFQHETGSSQQEIIRANRNITLEGAGAYQLSESSVLNFTYRYNHAVDPGTVSGYLFDFTATFSNIVIIDQLYMDLRPQLFYFDHKEQLDGLFTSVYLAAGFKKIPFTPYFRGVQRLWSNFTPSPVFQWSVGVQHVF